MTDAERNERQRRERDKIRLRAKLDIVPFGYATGRLVARARAQRQSYREQHAIRLTELERDIYGEE